MSKPSSGPLKPHWLHILLALAERDLHGSQIVREVLEQTDGAVRIWPVTLYGSLEEMAEEGLIRELAGEEHPEGASERRRYYSIEPRGRRVLRREAERLASLAELALERVGDA
jgi:DNA-binding PadR family transcriptional regulator